MLKLIFDYVYGVCLHVDYCSAYGAVLMGIFTFVLFHYVVSNFVYMYLQ